MGHMNQTAITTYSAAAKHAEVVTLPELELMLASDPWVTIFPKAGAHRAHNQSRIITVFHGSDAHPEYAFIGFDRPTRTGWITRATAEIRYAIFEFYNTGRIVRVVF